MSVAWLLICSQKNVGFTHRTGKDLAANPHLHGYFVAGIIRSTCRLVRWWMVGAYTRIGVFVDWFQRPLFMVSLAPSTQEITGRWTGHRLRGDTSDAATVCRTSVRVGLAVNQIGRRRYVGGLLSTKTCPLFSRPTWSDLWAYSLDQNSPPLDTLDRYLGTDGRQLRNQICDLVRKKDELDVHWAMQNQLRLCTTMHVVGLWALGVLITVHVVTVLAFIQRG